MKKKSKVADLSLSPPWVTYFNKLKTFFQEDEEVRVQLDTDDCVIKIYVDNEDKADALIQLLPVEKKFGNMTIPIHVIPCNLCENKGFELLKKALDGNEAVSFIESVSPQKIEGSEPFHYVVFNKEVVQYWNDNLADYYGFESTLYQELAKEIFEDANLDGVYFCTDEC